MSAKTSPPTDLAPSLMPISPLATSTRPTVPNQRPFGPSLRICVGLAMRIELPVLEAFTMPLAQPGRSEADRPVFIPAYAPLPYVQIRSGRIELVR